VASTSALWPPALRRKNPSPHRLGRHCQHRMPAVASVVAWPCRLVMLPPAMPATPMLPMTCRRWSSAPGLCAPTSAWQSARRQDMCLPRRGTALVATRSALRRRLPRPWPLAAQRELVRNNVVGWCLRLRRRGPSPPRPSGVEAIPAVGWSPWPPGLPLSLRRPLSPRLLLQRRRPHWHVRHLRAAAAAPQLPQWPDPHR